MAKILMVALAGTLLLGACSSLKPVEGPTASSSSEFGASPEALSIEVAPDLTQDISLADVLAAIEDLRLPRAVSVTLITTYPADLGETMTPGNTISTTETTTSDPTSPIIHVSVDRTEFGAAIESQLAEAAAAETASDTEETWLPAYGAVSAGDSVAMEFLIDQAPERPEVWIKMSDHTNHEKAQSRAAALIYGIGDYEPGT